MAVGVELLVVELLLAELLVELLVELVAELLVIVVVVVLDPGLAAGQQHRIRNFSCISKAYSLDFSHILPEPATPHTFLVHDAHLCIP